LFIKRQTCPPLCFGRRGYVTFVEIIIVRKIRYRVPKHSIWLGYNVSVRCTYADYLILLYKCYRCPAPYYSGKKLRIWKFVVHPLYPEISLYLDIGVSFPYSSSHQSGFSSVPPFFVQSMHPWFGKALPLGPSVTYRGQSAPLLPRNINP